MKVNTVYKETNGSIHSHNMKFFFDWGEEGNGRQVDKSTFKSRYFIFSKDSVLPSSW